MTRLEEYGRPEKYGHGGDLQTAGELYGLAPDEFIDFSANINPLGPPHAVVRILSEQSRLITRYPDPAQRQFRAVLAEKLGVRPEMLLAGNGAAECMALAILAFSPRIVGVVHPCFSEYAALAAQFGAAVQACRGREENGFLPDMSELRPLIAAADMLFIGHPNNPTGTVYSLEMLRAIAAECESHGCHLVIDEAFLDFFPLRRQVSLLDRLEDYSRVLIIRSMTKFYAIPGLRLGFAVSRPDNIAALKGKQVSWSVNQLALAAGAACLRDSGYESATRRLIRREREFLLRGLAAFAGLQTWSSEVNYLLVRLPAPWRAADLQRRLGERGILIRDCSMYPGLTERDVRIAVKSRADNEALLRALNGIVKGA